MNFLKTCGCGKKYDLAQWSMLPPPKAGGFQSDPYGHQIGLALKNCSCGSTLAVRVLKSGNLAV